MLRSSHRMTALAAVLALVLAPAALLAAPATEPKPKAESPCEKIRKALDQNIESLEIVDQPLSLAINQLKEQTKINFVLDTVTLANSGIVPDNIQVNVKMQNVKARAALRAVINPQHLGYAIIGDSVIITTEDMALHRLMKQKVEVDFDKVTLEAALKDLSKQCSVQILVDKKVSKEAQGQITLQLEDETPLDTAIRLLCLQADLRAVRMGNVIYVTGKDNAKELRSEPELAPNPYPGVPGVDYPVPNPPGGIGIGGIGGIGGVTIPIATPAAPPPPEDKPKEEKKEDKKEDKKDDK
jgi:hypothetical protein